MKWLVAILALIPGAAWAEVCDKERPSRDGSHITMVDEVALQLSNPLVAIWILGVLVFLSRSTIAATAAAVAAMFVFIALFAEPNPMDDIHWAAAREGCVGDPTLWFVLLAALTLMSLLLLGTRVRKRLS